MALRFDQTALRFDQMTLSIVQIDLSIDQTALSTVEIALSIVEMTLSTAKVFSEWSVAFGSSPCRNPKRAAPRKGARASEPVRPAGVRTADVCVRAHG